MPYRSLRFSILAAFAVSAQTASATTNSSSSRIETIEIQGEQLNHPITLTSPGKSTLELDDIQREQAHNIGELVMKMPGVSLDAGARPGSERINVWGFSHPSALSVRIDGAPVGFQQYRYGSFFIDPQLLRSVRVVRGDHNVRASVGAFGGSFIMETKEAADFLDPDSSIGAMAQAGFNSVNQQWKRSVTTYGVSDAGWSALLHGSRRDADDIELGNGDVFTFSGYRQHSLLGKIRYQSNAHNMMLSHTRYDDQGRKPWANRRGTMPSISDYKINKYGSYEAALFATSVDNHYREYTSTLNYHYQPFNDNIDTRVVIAHSQNHRYWERPDSTYQSYITSGQYGHQVWLSYERWFAEITNTSYLGDHEVMIGAQYQDQDRDSHVYNHTYRKKPSKNNGYYTPNFEPSGAQQTASVFVQDKYFITPDLELTASLRYSHIRSQGVPNPAPDYNDPSVGHDYSAISHQGWEPRVALTYDVSASTQLKAAYAYGMKAPTIDELYTVQYAKASKRASSSRDLSVTRINAYLLGLSDKRQNVLTAGDHLASEVTLFWNDIIHDVAQRRGVNATKQKEGYYTNLDGRYTYGFDAQLQYRLGKWSADASVSMVRGKHKGSLRDSTGDDEYWYENPPLNAKLGIGHQLTDTVQLGWQGQYWDEQDRLPENSFLYTANVESDAYFFQNLYGEWKPSDDFVLHAAIVNLTDQYYTPYLSAGVPAAGRDIRINATMRF
ncbi:MULTISPECIES: TonB-dependent receptor domain-containing protein [unclassified Salinivibrio]|uniref:TonB-dependent receptor domain-containing protein n=1 Tax=unclassified Salinivibrio TaxID=2636825 RepID=UPI00128E37E3|nr:MULTISPECIES: TonB-dependent receptor [unclassified Salinivibrio]MPS30951.1 TonB-dependent receptor [Salinivibrio sp. VYel7]MPX92352.1 TonB-dependent receptor [Salinivibrio sp. VYel9]MPX97072.1 TonB-dependent receptor [Salinivibrio sp. VYel6]MPX98584.1 TonB-dependent receptor [Salinivibrio sp. VYel4]MPY01715.1 TonB-dependent receptor [Salinivibrio sp. VYel5]